MSGLSERPPGGGWSPPHLFGIVLRCKPVPVALCGLSLIRWADMKPEVIVHLRMKQEAHGGRHGPFTAGYCPHLRVRDSEWLGVRVSHVPAPVFPGQAETVRLELMYHPSLDYSLLKPGVQFVVLEGARTVGEGEVIDVLPNER